MIINKLSIKKICQSFVRNGKSQKSIDNVFDKIDNGDNQALTKLLSKPKKADKSFLTTITLCYSMIYIVLSFCQKNFKLDTSTSFNNKNWAFRPIKMCQFDYRNF